MRFIRLLAQNPSLRSVFRFCSLQTKCRVLRVLSLTDDDSIKLSFSNSPSLTIKVPKTQDVRSVLSVIKLKYALLRKREEIRKAVVSKFSSAASVAVETVEEYEDVFLYANNKLIDDRTPNIDAWAEASLLKIGDVMYEVQYNTPAVKNMTLPDYIICGCYIRPHFMLECATFEDCIFTWYRSVLSNVLESEENLTDWIKVGEGFHYLVASEDIGCYLKVLCSPRQGIRTGSDFSSISKNTVEAGPGIHPSEERHDYTSPIYDSSRFRCVSYNTLANMYVEKRKFPYTSEKARDVYYRKQLLTKELLGYNSDIICLQEVQERVFDFDFHPLLQKFGYDGFYMKKGGRRHEGLATFFRTSKFKVVLNKGILLNEIIKEKGIFGDLLSKVSGNYKDMSKLLSQDTAFQTILLENAENSENKILIANTHLYSNKDMPEVRLLQAALCVYYLEHLVKTKLADCTGIIFCGDFNSLPDSDAYNFITSGNFQCCPSWKNNNIDSIDDTTLRHNLCLESACGTPVYTNFTEEFQGCLDYIFYSKDFLEVTETVPMPSHEMVTAQVGLPNEYFPSDHLALVCTLKWKNKIT